MTHKMRRALLIALLPLVFPLLLPRLAGAQAAAPDPLIQITPQQASTFFSAFTALSQQSHVAVVAEDQPLHPALTPQAAAGLRLDKEGEPLFTLLPRLAAAYDYDVQPSGKVLLLKKRYTDPADLPSITAKECALGLEELNGYAENFNPHLPLGLPDRSPVISDLIYSLTPEELEAMGDIHRGVPVASLAPVQQQEVWQFLLHLYVQTAIADLPSTSGAISRVAATDPQFSWRDLTQIMGDHLFARLYPNLNAALFGYDTTKDGGKPIFMTMSKPDQIKVYFSAGMHISMSHSSPPVERQAGAQQAETAPALWQFAPSDATDPLPAPANAPAPVPPVSSSLADLLTRLNARAADGLRVTVEPYLAPKRATAFGEAWATPRQEVAALADIYGLRVFKDDPAGGHDRLRLTRQTARAPLDVAALHDSLLQSLPDPLVRACRMLPAFPRYDPDAPASPIPAGLSPLLVYAVRQIRTAAEPKIRASKDGKVALSALSEQEGRAFAMTLMADVMESLRGLTTAALPKEFARFSDLRLSGGLHDDQDGKKRLTLLLALPKPNDPSTLQVGIGVGGMNYDPVNHSF